jgi:hypothetical protein
MIIFTGISTSRHQRLNVAKLSTLQIVNSKDTGFMIWFQITPTFYINHTGFTCIMPHNCTICVEMPAHKRKKNLSNGQHMWHNVGKHIFNQLHYCSSSLVWYVWEHTKNAILVRCLLLVNMQNGVKLSYYWGKTKT